MPSITLGLLLLSVVATWISQSLLDLFTISVLILLIFHVRKQLRSDIIDTLRANKLIFTLFLGYFVTAVLGYIFNARPEADALGNLRKFDWILQLLFLVIAARYSLSALNIKKLSWLIYLAFIPALYGFSIFFTNQIDLITGRYSQDRILGLVDSPTYHAYIGALLLTALFVWAIENKKLNFVNIALMITMFASMMMTKTRGALISLAISLFIYLTLYLWNKHKKFAFMGLAFALTAVVSSTSFYFSGNREESDSCRKDLIWVHAEMIKSHPLLGIGYRDNLRNIKDYWPQDKSSSCKQIIDEGTQAHNQYINVAATTGLIGFLFFAAFYLILLLKSFKASQLSNLVSEHSTLLKITFFVILTFSVGNMFETLFEFAKIRHLLLIAWAFTLAIINNQKSKIVS